MVKPKIAAEALGCSTETLCQSKKYKNFYKRSPINKRDAWFDLDGYLDYEAEKSDLISRTLLLIEYIIHEIGVSLRELSRMCDVYEQQIFSHQL